MYVHISRAIATVDERICSMSALGPLGFANVLFLTGAELPLDDGRAQKLYGRVQKLRLFLVAVRRFRKIGGACKINGKRYWLGLNGCVIE